METSLVDLWLPILVSGIAVFFASCIVWMVLPHHKADIKGMPGEEGLLAALRGLPAPPGTYMFPFCKPEEMKDPAVRQKWEAGPWGTLILPGARPNFGRNLGLMFAYNLVVGIFVAYVGAAALPRGAEFADVFQICGATAVLGFAAGTFPINLFFGRGARTITHYLFDGVFYGLIAGAVFGWLWPAVS